MTLHLRLKLQASAAGLRPGADETVDSLEKRLREKADRDLNEARSIAHRASTRRLAVAS